MCVKRYGGVSMIKPADQGSRLVNGKRLIQCFEDTIYLCFFDFLYLAKKRNGIGSPLCRTCEVKGKQISTFPDPGSSEQGKYTQGYPCVEWF